MGSFRSGAPTSPSTLSRWIKHGIRLPNGEVVRLEAVTVAGRMLTSRQRLVAFIAKQQGAGGEPTAEQSPTPARRTRAKAATTRQLDAALGNPN